MATGELGLHPDVQPRGIIGAGAGIESRMIEPDRWSNLRRDATAFQPPPVPTLVVVPHPDDEVLSAGGLIGWQRRHDVPVTILAVTDGESAYPDTVPAGRLGPIRRREQLAALDALGVDEADVVRAGLPDGHVADHEDDLVRTIETLGAEVGLLVAPWTLDHHCDHEACGRAAVRAAERLGVALVQTLFWAWHHDQLASVDPGDVRALPLDGALACRRRDALTHHRSQIGDELAPRMLRATDLETMSWDREYHLGPRP